MELQLRSLSIGALVQEGTLTSGTFVRNCSSGDSSLSLEALAWELKLGCIPVYILVSELLLRDEALGN